MLSRSRLFVTAFEGEHLLTLGLDRETGEILWRAEAPRARVSKVDHRNNAASPTPAIDDEVDGQPSIVVLPVPRPYGMRRVAASAIEGRIVAYRPGMFAELARHAN